MQLRQSVSGIGLERLLRNRPVRNSEQQSVLLENGEGGEDGKEPTIDIKRKKSLTDCC